MLEAGETLENRNLRVAGSVDVTGGTATIGASGTWSYIFGDGTRSEVAAELFPMTQIAPGLGSSFAMDIPVDIPPGSNPAGTFDIVVTGMDQNGGMVNVSHQLTVPPDATTFIPNPCVEDEVTLCLLDRFQVNASWTDFNGNQGPGVVVDRARDRGTFRSQGAQAGDLSDLFVRLEDRCADEGVESFELLATSSTDLEITLIVTDLQTNLERALHNELGQVVGQFFDLILPCEAAPSVSRR